MTPEDDSSPTPLPSKPQHVEPVLIDLEHVVLDEPTAVGLARMLTAQQRHADAANVYARLAVVCRNRTDYLARAHLYRGLHLITESARAEARLELHRALALDANLDDARLALDSMETTRLRAIVRPIPRRKRS